MNVFAKKKSILFLFFNTNFDPIVSHFEAQILKFYSIHWNKRKLFSKIAVQFFFDRLMNKISFALNKTKGIFLRIVNISTNKRRSSCFSFLSNNLKKHFFVFCSNEIRKRSNQSRIKQFFSWKLIIDQIRRNNLLRNSKRIGAVFIVAVIVHRRAFSSVKLFSCSYSFSILFQYVTWLNIFRRKISSENFPHNSLLSSPKTISRNTFLRRTNLWFLQLRFCRRSWCFFPLCDKCSTLTQIFLLDCLNSGGGFCTLVKSLRFVQLTRTKVNQSKQEGKCLSRVRQCNFARLSLRRENDTMNRKIVWDVVSSQVSKKRCRRGFHRFQNKTI